MRRLALVAVALTLLTTGCATYAPMQPPLAADISGPDISGRWTGVWIGYGIEDIARREPASAELRQAGANGYGRIVLENTSAAEAVPKTLRLSGLTGAPVLFFVSGTEVVLVHELDDQIFTINMTVSGDHMAGTVRHAYPPVRLVLDRVRPPAPAAKTDVPPGPAPPPVPAAVTPPAAPPASAAPPAREVSSERPAPATFTAVPDLRPIYFDFDRSDIRVGDAVILDANARWLSSNKDTQVIVEGHCDERGTNEYNIALGERRARAARDYLVSRGIETTRITVLSYGEDRPVCTEHTEVCWAQNRRAEFRAKAR